MRIAFNTANLVGRVTGYQFELKNWGAHHQKTMALTDEASFRDICREIKSKGFDAIELWEAHAAPETTDERKAKIWKSILDENGLQVIGYAGSFRPETVRVCQWLNIPFVAGGARQSLEETEKLARESGVKFYFENHPEKSVEEILDKINGDSDVTAVAVDTGWLGTQGADAPAAIRALGAKIKHVHLKDVKAHGGHETCVLGNGVVDISGVVAALKEIGYVGWYSWEDEPEDRNPFDSAIANRKYIEKLLSQ